MKTILIFSALFLLACETAPIIPPDDAPAAPEVQSESDCIDTGENIECESYSPDAMKREADNEELKFSEAP